MVQRPAGTFWSGSKDGSLAGAIVCAVIAVTLLLNYRGLSRNEAIARESRS